MNKEELDQIVLNCACEVQDLILNELHDVTIQDVADVFQVGIEEVQMNLEEEYEDTPMYNCYYLQLSYNQQRVLGALIAG